MYLCERQYDLISPLLAPHVSVGDEVSFPLARQLPIILERRSTLERRRRFKIRDVYQVSVGYVSQPRQDKRGEYFVTPRS